MPRLVRNAARCRQCGTEIESKHRHDFVSCPCRAIFVDGGLAYTRRGTLRKGATLEDIEDLSEYA